MGRVVSSATMSLDGFVALPDDTIGHLFDWYEAGDVEVPTDDPGLTFHLTPESADYWRSWTAGLGALVVGRRLFDVTDGWRGRHPLGVPVVVVTHGPPTDWDHPDAPFDFVTSGVADAVERAQAIAGDRVVGVAAGTIAGQCLALGLLDEVAIDLVPEVLGHGKPYFADCGPDVPSLADPAEVIPSRRVTHLRFTVPR